MDRSSGVLLHIATLPGKYGIGQLGESSRKFVDFLSLSGQSYWQVLPLVPTGYGDSPYQSVCSYAGSEYFIDLDTLSAAGLLTAGELNDCTTPPDSRINYEWLYRTRFGVLRRAFSRFDRSDAAFAAFLKKGEYADYALFRAVKDFCGGRPWNEWPDELRFRDEAALSVFAAEHAEDLLFWQWAQYEFDRQWTGLRDYAHSKGIRIIGDMPIYLAYDSVECWKNPGMVKLNASLTPVVVAGCPPDAFCDTGQLWGNPVYDWERMKADGYAWWKQRLRKCFSLFDVVRIDHFRGFDRYYEIPYGEPTAVNGKWMPGPSAELFEEIEKDMGRIEVIAEDLGDLDDSARAMFARVGYPGMKVLQFAFGSGPDNEYLPHNYRDSNCVVYTGTHDNDTLMGFIKGLGGERARLSDAVSEELTACGLSMPLGTDEELCDAIIELAFASKAECAMLPMQDWLKIGGEGRINMPSTLSPDNWSYRMPATYTDGDAGRRMSALASEYGRRQ